MDAFFSNDSTAIIAFITCGVLSAIFSGAETAITGLGSLKAKHILDTRGEKAKELKLCYTIRAAFYQLFYFLILL